MATEQTFGQKTNTWVQTFGIVIAAVWAVYTFNLKEVWGPQAAPVNITVDLHLRKIVPSATPVQTERKLIAVEMRVSAKNPSTREVQLLQSVWIAYGVNVVGSADDTTFATRAAASLNSADVNPVERHAEIASRTIIATGRLFTDWDLKPNETTMRTVLLYVPIETYDYIELEAFMPTINKNRDKNRGVALEWQLVDDMPSPFMYRTGANGEHNELKKDAGGSYIDPLLEPQMAISRSQFSLWQEDTPPRPGSPSGG